MGGTTNGSNQNKDDDLARKLTGRCPEATVSFAGAEALCLVDTGAEVSIVTETFFREKLLSRGLRLQDPLDWMRITAANGTDMPYMGYVELDITVLGHTFHDMAVLVLHDLPETAARSMREYKSRVPGVVGNNILRRMFEQLKDSHGRHYDRKLLEDNASWAQWITILNLYKATQDPGDVHSTHNGHIGFIRLQRRNPVRIPAGTVKTLKGKLRDECSSSADIEGKDNP